MNFQQYLQSMNPDAAMSGAMAGPTGGSFGQLAMQMLGGGGMGQGQPPRPSPPMQGGGPAGGPSLPDPGPGAQMQGGPGSPQGNPWSQPGGGPQMAQAPAPPMQGGQDPEYERGYQLGMMLRQLMGQGGQ